MFKRLISNTIILLAVISSSAQAQPVQFKLNLSADTYQRGKNLPKPKAIGQVTLANGVQLPAYQVYFTSGASDKAFETSRPNTLNLAKSINSNFASALAAYYFDNVWLVIPKNWQLVNAQVGADGSSSIKFAPVGQSGYFEYWANNGGCYGCGLSAASLFFKEADQLNQREYDAKPQYHISNPKIQSVELRPHTQGWRTTINGQNIDGVAYFNAQDNADTRLVEVSLPKSQTQLATPILNWWLK